MRAEGADPTDGGNMLLATDRCDRCGAQAWAAVFLEHGEILLCAHHLREHRDALTAAGAVIHDETATLNSPEPDATHTPRATTLGDSGPS